MSKKLVNELEMLANSLKSGAASNQELSITALAERIANNLHVKADEVVILAVSGKWRHLYFLVPQALRNVGHIPLSSTSALAARTVRDSAILLRSMAGHDPKDTTSVDRPVPDYEAAVGRSIKGLKIGVPKEYRVDGMAPEIETLWEQGVGWLKAAGAEIVEISLPHTKYALPAYYIVAPAEASSNLARYDGVRYGLRVPGRDVVDMYQRTRAEGFGKEVRRRVMIGTYVLSAGYYDAYYLRAQKVRMLIKRDFEDCFAQDIHAILTPATPSPAFGIGEKGQADPIEMYLNDVFTVTVNMAGLPGMAVPAGLSPQGLPLALQLIGRPFDEETLFSLGQVIEDTAGRFTPEKWW